MGFRIYDWIFPFVHISPGPL